MGNFTFLLSIHVHQLEFEKRYDGLRGAVCRKRINTSFNAEENVKHLLSARVNVR